jgi:hypothetical protein
MALYTCDLLIFHFEMRADLLGEEERFKV